MNSLRKGWWVVTVVAAIVAIPAVVESFAAVRDALVVRAQDTQNADSQQITPNKIEFENDQIKVIRGFLAPHQKTPVHSHPYRFGVTLTKNDLLITSDGKTVPSKKNAQEIFWSEPVTHQVENVSTDRMQNIEIEFKKDKGPGVEVKKDWSNPTAKGTADDPVPVEQEPHHRVIFENQYVHNTAGASSTPDAATAADAPASPSASNAAADSARPAPAPAVARLATGPIATPASEAVPAASATNAVSRPRRHPPRQPMPVRVPASPPSAAAAVPATAAAAFAPVPPPAPASARPAPATTATPASAASARNAVSTAPSESTGAPAPASAPSASAARLPLPLRGQPPRLLRQVHPLPRRSLPIPLPRHPLRASPPRQALPLSQRQSRTERPTPAPAPAARPQLRAVPPPGRAPRPTPPARCSPGGRQPDANHLGPSRRVHPPAAPVSRAQAGAAPATSARAGHARRSPAPVSPSRARPARPIPNCSQPARVPVSPVRAYPGHHEASAALLPPAPSR